MTITKPQLAGNETPEDLLRESLRDLIVVLEKLNDVCESCSDLKGMLELAVENEGQLRLLFAKITGKK